MCGNNSNDAKIFNSRNATNKNANIYLIINNEEFDVVPGDVKGLPISPKAFDV